MIRLLQFLLKDVLGLLPSGLGKSLTGNLPAFSLCLPEDRFEAVVPRKRSLLALDKLKKGRYELNELELGVSNSENKLWETTIKAN